MANVVVIGGGASGALVSAKLLCRLGHGDRVVLIEPHSVLGCGVAYGTSDRCHQLNVKGAKMSAWPDRPDHFVQWLVANNLADPASAPERFAARTDYGRYLGSVLEEAIAGSEAEFVQIKDRAVSVSQDPTFRVTTESGHEYRADELVLSLGNLPPKRLNIPEADRYIANPWSAGMFDRIGSDESVLIVGCGLTMVDAVLSLHFRGHHGQIYARSRRGQLPKPHCPSQPQPIDPSLLEGKQVHRSITKAVRAAGHEWRSVLDALRPHTVSLWQNMSWSERGRFLRRLQPFWDVHRHRMPEDTMAVIDMLREAGRLDVGKGRVADATWSGDEFEVQMDGETPHRLTANWIINCTGPNVDWQAAGNPLLESLVQLGLASYDPLGLGLMVDEEGRVGSGRVWALGALCRGCRWETTAIPEIRQQATRIAEAISSAYGVRGIASSTTAVP